MMSLIRDYQLDIMLFMMGVCAVLSLTMMVAKSIPGKRRGILAVMAAASAFLLAFERCAYIYRGDPGELAFFMVRISNGMVFFLLLLVPFLVTQYLKELYKDEGALDGVPACLKLADLCFIVGTLVLIISQFTDLYYSFDANNVYQRSFGIVISYVPPMLVVFFQMASLIQVRGKLASGLFWSLVASIALPVVASIVQLFHYGVSLTCMATAFVVVFYYIYMMGGLYKTAERAKNQEIEFYKESRKLEAAMFSQTVEALVSAIDAKDLRTRGHSARVALYSRLIAKRAGFDDEQCEQLYFTALLHDIGKIGVPDAIISKPGRLTEDEYTEIKLHTVMGEQMLASIKQAPYLGVGARSHHERYDGTGYPDGLSGEDIPEVARIIAVADAYDVMTSKRSYQKPLSPEFVRQEFVDGSGGQFDPRFAAIMLDIIDHGHVLPDEFVEEDEQKAR